MKGTYRFYQEGVCVGEAKNLITTHGKNHIVKYLAGYTGSIAQAIAVGAGSTAANLDDTSLEFEWTRQPVDLVSADYINVAIIFKGQIPSEASGVIYEVGLWSDLGSGNIYDSRLLLKFDSTNELWTTGTWETTTQRVGEDNLRLAPATGATLTSSLENVNLELSGFSSLDKFRWAYNVNSAFVSTVSLVMYTDPSNYFTYTVSTPAAGYAVTEFGKADCTITGAPSWSSITSVDVQVVSTGGGSGSVDFDGLRIEDKDLNSETYTLVSRAIPATPITKLVGLPMDFEYTLDLTI